MKKRSTHVVLAIVAMLAAGATNAGSVKADKAMVERGRYLVRIAGCNDCHTPSYPESNGTVPHGDWLTGTVIGWQGPWGTTYPANLRLVVQTMSEADWLRSARREMRPPMPWFALRDMSDADLKAIYHFVRSLGPKGEPVPAYVPPGETVATPYFEFVPKGMPPKAQAAR